jgi:hypothetical protein
MTFAELLQRTEGHCAGRVLDGDATQTLARLRDGSHRDAAMQPVLKMVIDWCALTGANDPVERAAVVNALGPMRLELMRSGKDLETYAALNSFIAAVDAAFDEAVLDADGRAGPAH